VSTVEGFRLRVYGAGFWVEGLVFRVEGVEFMVWG
jgi:hypothetical protein